MKRLIPLLKFIDTLNVWVFNAVSYVIFPLIGILFSAVFFRYVLNDPIIWAHEMSIFLFGGLGILAGPYCLSKGIHIKMDLLYNRLSPRGKAIMDVLTAFLFFYFITMLLWQGCGFALHSFAARQHAASPWAPALYPFKAVIPVATFMMLLQGLSKFIRDIYVAIHGRPLS